MQRKMYVYQMDFSIKKIGGMINKICPSHSLRVILRMVYHDEHGDG